MSIDIHAETLVPVSQIPKHVPTRPSLATVWRWLAKGARGQRLESTLIGGARYTTVESIARFIAATTAAGEPVGTPKPTATPRQRQAAIDRARRELDSAGL